MKNRLTRLREQIANQPVDGMLILKPENRRYISGFTGSAGYLLVTSSDAVLITDFRYTEQAREQAPHFRVVEHGSSAPEAIRSELTALGVKRLGFEKDYLTYSLYSIYKDKFEGVELEPTEGIVEKLRAVKDDQEIEWIRQAARIADDAFSHILAYLKPGARERDIALELEYFMRRKGAKSSSFDIIVASGVRSSFPHGVASDKLLERGDFVKMDFGALYEGYCSDITRTVVLGEPSDKQREIYNIVLEAQMYALEHIKPGMSGKEADALARDIIKEKGYGEHFGHSLGHGLGLYIHEEPRLSTLSSDILQPGMVVTVEPGIYIPGMGGVRIEDDVAITETGLEILTASTKELVVL
ncbi:M24 family metallopeptidase [Effusibacillus lacus]|uniref:Xaa-Pro dipeptidase n=1 Tax=Effusibacillus lacus TaxID=1348429 RepID=A0A292YIK0_9BACL|nr:Xaa-Pro peptidase family protein [Effusibacillus lacus]TCS72540.1 Xaa-Pro aminopeptidase [Effusibacillus lacus]GAX90897.1 Xaa-Pro dipeptidase [Effusibacillus lacus]